ncbi:MAG TPA: GGDEF domain-containing protein [Isosphaeraceae bacterium]|nr:GGDEF domain-containing protein [Isosphaeraceae bacterium]
MAHVITMSHANPWGSLGEFLTASPYVLHARISPEDLVVDANPCMQVQAESGVGQHWEALLDPTYVAIWREAAGRLSQPGDWLVLTLSFKGRHGVFRCLLERAADGCLWFCGEPAPAEGPDHARDGGLGAEGFTRRLFELEGARAKAEREARTDPLTGLGNRRQEAEWIEAFTELARKSELRLACLVVDLDEFHAVNDSFSHPVGDCVLQEVARALSETIRSADRLSRHGGDEFVILLPDTDLAGGLALANRLRLRLAALRVSPIEAGVEACVGVARLEPGELPESLIARADAALLRAKRAGRNRVEVA